MSPKNIMYGVAAFGLAAVGFVALRKRGAAPLAITGDAERSSGIGQLYAYNAGQQEGFSAAVQQQWQQLQRDVFQSQPDFWV